MKVIIGFNLASSCSVPPTVRFRSTLYTDVQGHFPNWMVNYSGKAIWMIDGKTQAFIYHSYFWIHDLFQWGSEIPCFMHIGVQVFSGALF